MEKINYKKWIAYTIAVVILVSYGELKELGTEWWYLIPYFVVLLIIYDWALLRFEEEERKR